MISRIEIKEKAKAQLGNNIFGNNWMLALAAIAIIGAANAVLAATGIGSIATIIISGPLSYALAYMFLKQARDGEQMDLTHLVKGFTSDFGGTFLLELMVYIFTLLWSLLFIIPGIVKGYAYSMAFYIKADNPDYDWNKCIKESMRLTSGHKMELFILDLSFIGWYLVGIFCLGIGILWVVPYHNAAKAQFYNELVATPIAE